MLSESRPSFFILAPIETPMLYATESEDVFKLTEDLPFCTSHDNNAVMLKHNARAKIFLFIIIFFVAAKIVNLSKQLLIIACKKSVQNDS